MATDASQPDPNRPTPVPRHDTSAGVDEDRGGRLLHASWSGPLPPPAQLRQYEEAHPGLAERLVVLMERQVAHRHQVDLKALDAEDGKLHQQFGERRRGQYLAFVLCLGLIVGGTWVSLRGFQAAGSVIAGTGPAVLAAAFIYGRVAGNDRK